MDWIVEKGVEKIPAGVPFERASLVEPVNTCLKAVVQCDPQPEDVVADPGAGADRPDVHDAGEPHRRAVVATDTMPVRAGTGAPVRRRGGRGIRARPTSSRRRKAMTEGRGADLVIVAASVPGIVEQAFACSRPGARILLFAQTSDTERIEVSGADICVGERTLFGCYSASVDLQKESARLVFGGEIPVGELDFPPLALDQDRPGLNWRCIRTENR